MTLKELIVESNYNVEYIDLPLDFWGKFTECVKDKEYYSLKYNGNKVTIFYDNDWIGEYDISKNSIKTADTSYFILPAKCSGFDMSLLDQTIKTAINDKDIPKILDMLQNRTVTADYQDFSLFKLAISARHDGLLEFLLSNDFDNTFNYSRLIVNAIELGNNNALKMLIDDGRVDPSNFNNLAIYLAIRQNNQSAVELLKDHPRIIETAINLNQLDIIPQMVKAMFLF